MGFIVLACHHCSAQEFATVGPMGFDLGCLLGVLLLAYVVLGHQPDGTAGSAIGGSAGCQPHSMEQDGKTAGGACGHEYEQPTSDQSGFNQLEPVGGAAAHGAGTGCGGRQAQRRWLLCTVSEMWGLLNQGFEQHRAVAAQRWVHAGGIQSRGGSMPSPASPCVWADTLGFAAFCMIRLTIGMHAYPGYEFLGNEGARVRAELQALDVSAELLALREHVARGGVAGMADIICAVQRRDS